MPRREVPDFATPSQTRLFQTIKSGHDTENVNSPVTRSGVQSSHVSPQIPQKSDVTHPNRDLQTQISDRLPSDKLIKPVRSALKNASLKNTPLHPKTPKDNLSLPQKTKSHKFYCSRKNVASLRSTQNDATLPLKTTQKNVSSSMKTVLSKPSLCLISQHQDSILPMDATQKECPSPSLKVEDVFNQTNSSCHSASSITGVTLSSSKSISSKSMSPSFIVDPVHVSSGSEFESDSSSSADSHSSLSPLSHKTHTSIKDSNTSIFPKNLSKSVLIIPREVENIVESKRESSPSDDCVTAASPANLTLQTTKVLRGSFKTMTLSPSDFIDPVRKTTLPNADLKLKLPRFKASFCSITNSPVPTTAKSPMPTTAQLPMKIMAQTPMSGTAQSPALRTANRAQTARAVIIMRHGERVDDCFERWFEKAASKSKKSLNRGGGGYKPFDLNMPQSLVSVDRPLHEYENDSPLTVMGALMAQKIGRCLSMMGRTPQIVYCSPSLRCIQTGGFALKMSQKPFIIRIEPGLFENTDLYSQQPKFLTPLQLQKAGYDIDTDYTPYYPLEDLFGEPVTTYEYNERVQGAIKYIVNRACDGNGTVLICGHASTVDLAYGTLHKNFQCEPRKTGRTNLSHIAERIPYCSNIVFTRKDDEDYWHYCKNVIPLITYENFSNRINLPYLERQPHTVAKKIDSKVQKKHVFSI